MTQMLTTGLAPIDLKKVEEEERTALEEAIALVNGVIHEHGFGGRKLLLSRLPAGVTSSRMNEAMQLIADAAHDQGLSDRELGWPVLLPPSWQARLFPNGPTGEWASEANSFVLAALDAAASGESITLQPEELSAILEDIHTARAEQMDAELDVARPGDDGDGWPTRVVRPVVAGTGALLNLATLTT